MLEKLLIEQCIVEWNQQVLQKSKLRTHITFKHIFVTETNVMQTLSKYRRSCLAQFRLGILPFIIETGRYTPVYDNLISILKRTEKDIHLRDYVRHTIWDYVKVKFILF